jgi:hypothetical protein
MTFYYNLPECRAKRSTTFGYGGKYDFTRDAKSKCNNFYNVPSDFGERGSSPKYSFGISRAYYDKVYYETNKMFDKNVPGPGKYNYLKPFGTDASKFSIVGRSEKWVTKKSNSPGPGEYPPVITINEKGKYPLSKIKNTPSITFGANQSKRFNYLCILFYLS